MSRIGKLPQASHSFQEHAEHVHAVARLKSVGDCGCQVVAAAESDNAPSKSPGKETSLLGRDGKYDCSS